MFEDIYTYKESSPAGLGNLILKIMSVVVCVCALGFFANPLLAQQHERQIVALEEADYECLQQLDCVAESKELRNKGWIVKYDETIGNHPQERTAKMKGEDIHITARYNKEGNLLRATYERKNVALPRVLLAHLAGDDFAGWSMTANNMTVRDFDAATTVYQVILEKDGIQKVASFSRSDIMDMKKAKSAEIASQQ